MLAQLIMALLVATPLGPLQVFLQLPMKTMAECKSWIDDPTPMLIHGVKVVGWQCVNKPTNPGAPA